MFNNLCIHWECQRSRHWSVRLHHRKSDCQYGYCHRHSIHWNRRNGLCIFRYRHRFYFWTDIDCLFFRLRSYISMFLQKWLIYWHFYAIWIPLPQNRRIPRMSYSQDCSAVRYKWYLHDTPQSRPSKFDLWLLLSLRSKGWPLYRRDNKIISSKPAILHRFVPVHFQKKFVTE